MKAKVLISALLLALIATIGLTSCKDEDDYPPGDWPAMKWIPDFGEDRGIHQISVPRKGGSYQYECTNYGHIWLTSFRVNDEYIEDVVECVETGGWENQCDWETIINWERVSASAKHSILTVKIEPNDSGKERSCKINIAAGNAVNVFCFNQKGE